MEFSLYELLENLFAGSKVVMGLKFAIKCLLLGRPGLRPRAIRWGLLRGLKFQIETATASQRLLGLAEREIVRGIREFASKVQSAVDIGAADGWYSLYFASIPNIQRVLAFEPTAAQMQQLRCNFALNDPAFAAKLSCVPKFLGAVDRDGHCTLDTATVDLPRPVLLKIDVDGGEVDVLRGAERLLASHEALFVVETHSPELEDMCLDLLGKAGYDCRVVRNGWYRQLVPETRMVPHNRWLLAQPRT